MKSRIAAPPLRPNGRRLGFSSKRPAEAWQAVLAGPVETVARFLADNGDRARQLRQTSPFAGFLAPRTRWEIWRRARRQAAPP